VSVARTSDAVSAAPQHARVRAWLDVHRPPTPCLVVDLEEVAAAYEALDRALPGTAHYFAVKACPEPDVLRLLAGLGASFDIASRGELDLCLALGLPATRLSFGNTIKRRADIRYAAMRGVRLFAFDSLAELEKIATEAPGVQLMCRLEATGEGAQWPLSRKFGCDPVQAEELILRAAEIGADVAAISFHVGSQQIRPESWRPAINAAAAVMGAVAERGVVIPMLNLGGGFPAHYRDEIQPLEAYGTAIAEALADAFPEGPPVLLSEPGRSIVADAGVLRSSVVLVSERHGERWVYTDVGRFSGLAETEGESIRYRIATSRDGESVGPVVLAGPTCDSFDILYERARYELPLGLRDEDTVDFLSTGAYTASYAAACFNGFAPPTTHCI
jgi:ornithine decarboxylase